MKGIVCHVCCKKSWPERKMGVGEERRGKERGGGGMTKAERESETGSQWRVKSCSSCISGEATVQTQELGMEYYAAATQCLQETEITGHPNLQDNLLY